MFTSCPEPDKLRARSWKIQVPVCVYCISYTGCWFEMLKVILYVPICCNENTIKKSLHAKSTKSVLVRGILINKRLLDHFCYMHCIKPHRICVSESFNWHQLYLFPKVLTNMPSIHVFKIFETSSNTPASVSHLKFVNMNYVRVYM